MRKLAVVSIAAVLASGCRATPRRSTSEIAAREAAGEPVSAAEAAALQQAEGQARDYKIAPSDLVSVTVYGEADLSRRVRVGESGEIFLPLAGSVAVGGKTLAEARALIAQKLAGYLRSPQVSVFIEEYTHKFFFVMGEVQKPGSFPLPDASRVTVLEAISMAGGLTPVAADNKTRVLRRINGTSVSFKVDVRTITNKGREDKDIVLEANDVVYIPQSMF